MAQFLFSYRMEMSWAHTRPLLGLYYKYIAHSMQPLSKLKIDKSFVSNSYCVNETQETQLFEELNEALLEISIVHSDVLDVFV